MTDFDLDRLGEVWRARPDPAELAALQRSAEKVRRRARISQIMDIVFAAIVGGVIIALALSNPRIETAVLGGVAILIMLGSQIRQRKVRAIELKSLTGSAVEMLDQSIARTRTSLRQTKTSLILIAPAGIVGTLFASTTNQSIDGALGWLSADPTFRTIWIGFWVGLVVLVLAGLVRTLRRQSRELGRLIAMREAYRREQEASRSA